MSPSSFREFGPKGIDLIRWPHRDHSLPEAEVIAFFRSRDIRVLRWVSQPDTVHPPHTHDYRKTLFCISGEISFSFPALGLSYTLHSGDRLIIPEGIEHSALVGSQGVTCIEGEAT